MAADATMPTTVVSAPGTGTASATRPLRTRRRESRIISRPSWTLLTTQLQHQNPMDPLDTNQFQQLVQFAGIEQQLNRTNS